MNKYSINKSENGNKKNEQNKVNIQGTLIQKNTNTKIANYDGYNAKAITFEEGAQNKEMKIVSLKTKTKTGIILNFKIFGREEKNTTT